MYNYIGYYNINKNDNLARVININKIRTFRYARSLKLKFNQCYII